MNRRTLIGAIGAGLGSLFATRTSRANSALVDAPPGALPLKLDEKLTIRATSKPVRMLSSDFPVVSIGTGTFGLSKDAHLTATLHAGVAQYADVEYLISIAVFDAQSRLLGAASL